MIWRSRSEFQIETIEYINMLKEHYTKLHHAATIDVNDLVPGYETLESTQATTITELIRAK